MRLQAAEAAYVDGYRSDPFPEWSTDESEEEERPRARRRRGGRGNSVAPDAVTEPAGPLPPHPLMVRLVEPSGSESGEVQFLGPFDNHDHDTEQVRQRVLRYLYHKAKLYRRLLRHTDGADYEEATVGEHGLDIYFELYSGTPILAEIRLLPDAAAVRGWELAERCDPIRVDLNKEQQRPMVLLTHPPERKDVLDAEEGLRQFYPGYRLTAAPAPVGDVHSLAQCHVVEHLAPYESVARRVAEFELLRGRHRRDAVRFGGPVDLREREGCL